LSFHLSFLVIIKLNEKQLSILINIKYYLKNNWHVGCFFAIRTTRDRAFRDQTVAFRVIFKSSRQPLHPKRHVWLVDLWFSVSGIFVFFFITFFSFSSINASNSPSFQNNPSIFFFQIWFMFFWLLFFLFEIIYKIGFSLILSSFNFFHLSDFVPILFFLLFVLLEIIFKIEYFFTISSFFSFFSYKIWSSLFLLLCFQFGIFFLISSFNVKLIGNWFYWLSFGLGFLSSPFSVWYWQLVFYIWLLSIFYSLL